MSFYRKFQLQETVLLKYPFLRFALACNNSTKIIEPIQSRCAVLRFTRLSDAEVLLRLRQVGKKHFFKEFRKLLYTCHVVGLWAGTGTVQHGRHGSNNFHSRRRHEKCFGEYGTSFRDFFICHIQPLLSQCHIELTSVDDEWLWPCERRKCLQSVWPAAAF